MPINKVTCTTRRLVAPGVCASICCKIIEAYSVDASLIATETYAAAQLGLCVEGTLTGWTLISAANRPLHSIALDGTFAHSVKYSTSITDGCTKYSTEVVLRSYYNTPENVCAATLLNGTTNGLIVRISGNPTHEYQYVNADGSATWTFETQSNLCKVDLKLSGSEGSRPNLPILVGGTTAATTTFITNNLATN